jgi:hypothetical protein
MLNKILMKLVCIDNNNTFNSTSINIKIGKSYDAIKLTTSKLTYDIICDDDVVRSLLKSRFITLEAHREKIINEILRK